MFPPTDRPGPQPTFCSGQSGPDIVHTVKTQKPPNQQRGTAISDLTCTFNGSENGELHYRSRNSTSFTTENFRQRPDGPDRPATDHPQADVDLFTDRSSGFLQPPHTCSRLPVAEILPCQKRQTSTESSRSSNSSPQLPPSSYLLPESCACGGVQSCMRVSMLWLRCPLGGAHFFFCSSVCHVTGQSTLIGSEKRRSYWGGQADGWYEDGGWEEQREACKQQSN